MVELELLREINRTLKDLKLDGTTLVIGSIVAIWAGPILLFKVTLPVGAFTPDTVLNIATLLTVGTIFTVLVSRFKSVIKVMESLIPQMRGIIELLRTKVPTASELASRLDSIDNATKERKAMQETLEKEVQTLLARVQETSRE